MGYRGKVDERARARELRAQGWVMRDIAEKLGVSRSSVSLWTRDVPFTPDPERTRNPRSAARRRGPNTLQRRKQEEIECLLAEGAERIGRAVPDGGIRHSKHRYGCATVQYCCTRTHRTIMGLVHALVAGPARAQWEVGAPTDILPGVIPG